MKKASLWVLTHPHSLGDYVPWWWRDFPTLPLGSAHFREKHSKATSNSALQKQHKTAPTLKFHLKQEQEPGGRGYVEILLILLDYSSHHSWLLAMLAGVRRAILFLISVEQVERLYEFPPLSSYLKPHLNIPDGMMDLPKLMPPLEQWAVVGNGSAH